MVGGSSLAYAPAVCGLCTFWPWARTCLCSWLRGMHDSLSKVGGEVEGNTVEILVHVLTSSMSAPEEKLTM